MCPDSIKLTRQKKRLDGFIKSWLSIFLAMEILLYYFIEELSIHKLISLFYIT